MEGSGTLGVGVDSVRMVRQAARPQELMFQVVGGSRQLTSLGGSGRLSRRALAPAPGLIRGHGRLQRS